MMLSQAAVSGSLTYMQASNTPEVRACIAHCLLHQKQPGLLLHPLGTSSHAGTNVLPCLPCVLVCPQLAWGATALLGLSSSQPGDVDITSAEAPEACTEVAYGIESAWYDSHMMLNLMANRLPTN